MPRTAGLGALRGRVPNSDLVSGTPSAVPLSRFVDFGAECQQKGTRFIAREEPLTNDPELTGAELAELRPAREMLSVEEFAALTSVRKALGLLPPKMHKVPVTIRLNRGIVDAFKAMGDGWKTGMSAELGETVKRLASG